MLVLMCLPLITIRGITLSPTISKLFELCIMEKFGHLFDSSDLQFGFKKSLGCSNAIFAVQSVTDYFSKHMDQQ